jgi:hypothetical protein
MAGACIDTAGTTIVKAKEQIANPLNGSFFAEVNKKKGTLDITYVPRQGAIPNREDVELRGSVNGEIVTLKIPGASENKDNQISAGQFTALKLSKQQAISSIPSNPSTSIPLKNFNRDKESAYYFNLESSNDNGTKYAIPSALEITANRGKYSVRVTPTHTKDALIKDSAVCAKSAE